MATELNQNSPASTSLDSVDDIYDALKADDTDLLADQKLNEEDDKPDKTKPIKDDNKASEEEPVELEDEEIKDEDLDDLITPARRKDILAKYPNLFKDFAYLEKAMYREQAYTEILPTIEEAKEAVEKSQTFERFEDSILKGSTGDVLKSVKDADPRAFSKIVDNYLPDLQKVDNGAYLHVVSNLGKNIIATMVNEAKRIQSEKLGEAATILNQFLFGNSEYVPPSNYSKQETTEVSDAQRQFQAEQEQFRTERLSTATEELATKSENIIRSTIDKNIDPKNAMSDYVKRTAIKEAYEYVDEVLMNDSRFQTVKDALWKKAMQSSFAKKDMDNLRNAILSKAKTILPEAIKKSRNEALKGMGKRVDDSDTNNNRDRTGPVNRGRTSTSNNEDKGSNSKATKTRMTTLEFLNSD